jgi:histidyl-tRNA synthetase
MIMCARLWRSLGLSDIELELNTLGSPDARARYRMHLVRYLEQHRDALDADSQRRLTTNPLRVLDSKNPHMQQIIENAPRLLDDLDEDSRIHFEAVKDGLCAAGVAFRINPRLVRGLDYYNRTVFEWTTRKLGAQGTVCAGGRYDGLIEQIGGKPASACGYAMGVERLITLMSEGAAFRKPVPDVYIVRSGDAAHRYAQDAAERMRDAGLAVVLHSGGGSFKSQMKKADASGARYAAIIGDDEAAAQQLTLKPLRAAAEQARIALDAAVERMRARD